jgi:hypothetical protein
VFRATGRPAGASGGDEFAVPARDVERASARAIGMRFMKCLDNEVFAGGLIQKRHRDRCRSYPPENGTAAEENSGTDLHSFPSSKPHATGNRQPVNAI